MILRKSFRFEASHILPRHPGKCSRLHGHSWVLHVVVEGEINKETGFVMDYAEISEKVKPLVDNLDHRHLGQWVIPVDSLGNKATVASAFQSGVVSLIHKDRMAPLLWDKAFYPSSENLLYWIGTQLKNAGLEWSSLALEETCTSYAQLTRIEFEKTCEKVGDTQKEVLLKET